MRPLPIAAAGGTLAFVAYAVSRSAAGYMEASAFLLAIFMATVTLGLVIALLVDGPEPSPAAVDHSRVIRGLRMIGTTAVSCGECYQPKAKLGYLWICTSCDGVPIEA
jgi:hypothetical protein